MRLCSIIVLLLLLSGCTAGDFPLLRREAKVLPEQAESFYRQGEFVQAAQAYMSLARSDRNNRSRYRLRAAEAWREEGSWSGARGALSELERRDLELSDAVLMDLLYAEMALNEGDVQGASDLLIMRTEAVPEDLHPRLFELRARAFEAGGSVSEAARERAMLARLLSDPADQEDNANSIHSLLAELSPEQRSNLLRTLDRNDPLYEWLTRKAGLAGSRGTATLTEELARPSPQVDAASAPALTSLEPELMPKVALLLPLSGEFAAAAGAIRDGVFSSYFSASGERPELVLVDSGHSDEQVIAAYDKAVEDGATLVIGPFAREQVSALFARGCSVPTLALNFADAALPPPGSQQFALLPEDEAVAAAERMLKRGLKRVTALVPDDEFGKRTLAAFTARFEAGGGAVVEPQRYNPAASAHSEVLRSALGVAESNNRAALVRAITGLNMTAQPTRSSDLEGIFLAARPQQARSLLPQLRSYDAASWPIVATSHIYGGARNAMDSDLNGVEFVDAPWLHESVPGYPTQAQVAGLASSQGPASRLFAFGMDAYQLSLRMLWLEQHPEQPVQAATGWLYSDGRGSLRRIGYWQVFGSDGQVQSAP